MTSSPPLAVERVTKRFQGNLALDDVSFAVQRGEVLGLVGPNGSGKTTLLNICNGVYRADRGRVLLDGEKIGRARAPRIAARGVARTFQSARVFDSLTVFENLRLPLLHRHDASASEIRDRARHLLESVNLGELADATASELSGGQRKLVEYCRALMPEPTILLMDEPFAGVHPSVKETMAAAIATHRKAGVAFVIVSHELPLMTRIVDRLLCLAEGSIIAQGAARDVCRDDRVIQAYLGDPSRTEE